jgi:hypothetical protein
MKFVDVTEILTAILALQIKQVSILSVLEPAPRMEETEYGLTNQWGF